MDGETNGSQEATQGVQDASQQQDQGQQETQQQGQSQIGGSETAFAQDFGHNLGVFALFALLFAVLRKPIAVMVFNVLSLLAFAVQYYDFSDRGVVPSDHFSWGWGMYLYVAAFILTVVCAIVTLIDRRRMRKQTSVS